MAFTKEEWWWLEDILEDYRTKVSVPLASTVYIQERISEELAVLEQPPDAIDMDNFSAEERAAIEQAMKNRAARR